MLPSINYNLAYICDHRDWFAVNRDYQRQPDAWTPKDKQYLIDTIIKDLDIPKVYLRKIGDKEYEIVDGQQRMQTIWDFRDNKFALEGKISGTELDGLKYRDLPAAYVTTFDGFNLFCVILEGYDDEKVRELFSRLQRGKPLNPGEKLNAFTGTIVPVMRKLADIFLPTKVSFSLTRYKAYHIAAKLMLLESSGITDISPVYLYNFFESNRNLSENSEVARRVGRVLRYLDEAFPEKTPEMNNDSWVINIYLLVSDLMDKYVIKDRKTDIRQFYVDYWHTVESARRIGKGDSDILRFAEANRAGTTSKANIETRFNLMKQRFVEKHSSLELLDTNRYFDHFEKTVIYRRYNGICQGCTRPVRWDEYEADHIKPHASGGKTTIDNGQVLCRQCNEKKSNKPFPGPITPKA